MATRRGERLLDGIRRLTGKTSLAIWRRYRVPLVVVLVLLPAFVLPFFVPQWNVYVAHLLWTNLLFVGTVGVVLLFLLLWKIPQRQVADVLDVKDRVDLELKARQTLAQIVGGAILLIGLYFTKSCQDAPLLAVGRNGILVRGFGGQIPPT